MMCFVPNIKSNLSVFRVRIRRQFSVFRPCFLVILASRRGKNKWKDRHPPRHPPCSSATRVERGTETGRALFCSSLLCLEKESKISQNRHKTGLCPPFTGTLPAGQTQKNSPPGTSLAGRKFRIRAQTRADKITKQSNQKSADALSSSYAKVSKGKEASSTSASVPILSLLKITTSSEGEK